MLGSCHLIAFKSNKVALCVRQVGSSLFASVLSFKFQSATFTYLHVLLGLETLSLFTGSSSNLTSHNVSIFQQMTHHVMAFLSS